nr:TonB-dependent receptor [Oceanococcus sp. HetDA_MAG_MS8]
MNNRASWQGGCAWALMLVASGLSARTELPPVSVESSAPAARVALDGLRPDLNLALRQLPGMQVRSRGGLGAYSEASLRGSSSRQVQVLLDGVALPTLGGAAFNLSLLPAAALDAATLDYERSRGLAGDLHLHTRESNNAYAEASVGSFGSQHLGLGGWQGWHAQIQGADNDFPLRNPFKPFDPSDPQRRADEPRNNAQTAQGSLLWAGESAHRALLVWNEEALPNQRNTATNEAQLRTALAFWATRLNSGLSLSLGWMDEDFSDRRAQVALAASETRAQTASIELALPQERMDGEYRLGLYRYRARDARGAAGDVDVTRVQLELPWSWVGAAGTLQSWVQLQPYADLSPQLGDDQGLAGQLGLRWAPQVHLSSAIQLRSRIPSLFERYGNRGLFQGNPDLAPEHAWEWQLQWQQPDFQAQGFVRWLQDAIVPQYTAQGLGRSQNAGRALVAGLSMNLQRNWGRCGQHGLNVDLLHTEDRSNRVTTGRQLPGRAPIQAIWSSLWALPGSLELRYLFAFEDGAFFDSLNLLATPTVRRHDLQLQGRWQQWLWRLEGRNLSDARYARFNGFPEPGRHWQLSLRRSF